MFNIQNLVNSVPGFVEDTFKEGKASLGYLGHRIVTLMNQAQKEINSNSSAAVTLFVGSNALFFLVANSFANGVNHRLFKEDGKVDQKNHLKKTVVNSLVVGVTVLSLNILLAKAAKFPLNPIALAALTATAVVGKLLLNQVKVSPVNVSPVDVSSSEKALGEAQKKISSLEKDLLASNKEVASANQLLQLAKVELDSLLLSSEGSHKKEVATSNKLHELTVEIASLKEEHQQFIKNGEIAQAKLEEQLDVALQNKGQLEEALHAAEKKNEQLVEAQKAFENKQGISEGLIKKLKNDMTKLENDVTNLEMVKTVVLNENKNLKKELAETKSQCESLEKRLNLQSPTNSSVNQTTMKKKKKS